MNKINQFLVTKEDKKITAHWYSKNNPFNNQYLLLPIHGCCKYKKISIIWIPTV